MARRLPYMARRLPNMVIIPPVTEADSLSARFAAALIGGVTTALVGCPFDVLKTRMMNQVQPLIAA